MNAPAAFTQRSVSDWSLRCIQELPAPALQILREAHASGALIDPADAWLAWQDDLTTPQARGRARNTARPLGSSWPDHLPAGALAAPLQILEACESVRTLLNAQNAPQKLLGAAWCEADTRAMADMFGMTHRRAQKIKKKWVDWSARRQDLFGDEDEEGGEA